MCGTGMRRSRGAGGLSQDLTSGGDGASRASVRLLAKRNVAANSPGGSGRSVPPSASELMDWETDPGETCHGGKPWGAKPRSWGLSTPAVTNPGERNPGRGSQYAPVTKSWGAKPRSGVSVRPGDKSWGAKPGSGGLSMPTVTNPGERNPGRGSQYTPVTNPGERNPGAGVSAHPWAN